MYYGNNDWRDYCLAHSWGTSPEMKQKEREYNAKYYQEHKEDILARRKKDRYGDWIYGRDFDYNKQGDVGFEGSRYAGKRKNWDLARASDEEWRRVMADQDWDTEIEAEMKNVPRSSWFKGLPPNVQQNVQAHNNQVTKNIEALQGHVDQFLQSHPDLPADQKNQLLRNLKSQIVKAEDEYITPQSSEDRAYVAELMKKAQKR